MDYQTIEELPKEKLVELIEIFSKNWLALDGVWFQSVEQKYGMEEAVEHDKNAWRRFTEIEARRIKDFLGLPKYAGLNGLKQALSFRLYAPLNQSQCYMEDGRLIYKVITCRVQSARARKKMAYHPCKPVGILEYTYFAKTIDPRIETKCLSCHPDVVDDSLNCCWEFTIKEDV